MHGTKLRSRTDNVRTTDGKPSSKVKATKQALNRRPADDRLLLLPEIAERIRRTEATLRWLRHVGGPDCPPIWKQGRRLVAWQSEIDSWLDAQREADEQANASS